MNWKVIVAFIGGSGFGYVVSRMKANKEMFELITYICKEAGDFLAEETNYYRERSNNRNRYCRE